MDLDKQLEELRFRDPDTYWAIEFVMRMIVILKLSDPYNVESILRLQAELRTLLTSAGFDPSVFCPDSTPN